MTGNIRYNLGLLVVALIAALVGWFLTRIEQVQDIGGILIFGAIVLMLAALIRLATELMRTPDRD